LGGCEKNFAKTGNFNLQKTKWGGFIEAKYQVKKDFPHKIIERETETLIDYNCGYVY